MKPAFESIIATAQTSFVVRKFNQQRFSAPYHFHPQLELTLILTGMGKRYVGSNMSDYFPDDLVLLGANLPHCWKTEDSGNADGSSSIVIQFEMDFMGKDFFFKPEMHLVLQLLNKSNFGLKFTANMESIKIRMANLLEETNGFKKMISLLDILYQLASLPDYIMLDKQSFYSHLSVPEKERINAVVAFIVENFQGNLSLADAAATINMTPNAFCKYFKKLTRKTFVEAVTDYRIDFAVRQLVHTDKPVSAIGYDSGFNDISNFHKTFRARMNQSPLGYRNMFMRKMV